MAYYSDVFTLETWNEFKLAGSSVSGFRQSRWGVVKKLKEDDRLLCYLKGANRWIGVLRVVGKPFQSAEPKIWASDDFPARVHVEIEYELTPETGVPVKDMLPQFSWHADLVNNPAGSWGMYLQGSPRLWSDSDGEAVVLAVMDATKNPVQSALPKAAYQAPKPKAVDSGTDLGDVTIPEDEEEAEVTAGAGAAIAEGQESEHTEIQALLVRLGGAMGYRCFVARGDQNKTWNGKTLASLPGVTNKLPTQFNDATNRVIEQIDVLWLDDNAIAAAFEIERTTSIYSGLLRMSDLRLMQPNLDVPIFVVAPDLRREKVLKEVNRPTFKKPLAHVCRYIPFDALREGVAQHSDLLNYLPIGWVREELAESCSLEE